MEINAKIQKNIQYTVLRYKKNLLRTETREIVMDNEKKRI